MGEFQLAPDVDPGTFVDLVAELSAVRDVADEAVRSIATRLADQCGFAGTAGILRAVRSDYDKQLRAVLETLEKFVPKHSPPVVPGPSADDADLAPGCAPSTG